MNSVLISRSLWSAGINDSYDRETGDEGADRAAIATASDTQEPVTLGEDFRVRNA